MSMLEDLIQQYDQLDQQHEALRREMREIETKKETIEATVLDKLRDLGADKLRSGPFDIERKKQRGYKAISWSDLFAWIFDNRRTDVLQKRISVTAMDDIAEDEGLPPGVEKSEWEKAHFKRVSKAR